MQRVKLGLLCLSWLFLASAVSAQTAVDTGSDSGIAEVQNFSGGAVLQGTYFDIRHVFGDGVGYTNSYSQIGAFTPIWMNEDTFIAPNTRLTVTNSTQIGVNTGLVGRRYVDSLDRIFGVYGYYDSDQDSLNFRYSQFTIGAETLGRWWDLRGNGYILNGMRENLIDCLGIGGNPFFSGNNIAFRGTQLRDHALGGGDVEFGVPVSPYTQWLRAYSGVYAYHANSSDTFGYRGRVEAMVSNDLTMGVMVSQDRLYGTNVNATIDFKFSGFQPTLYFPNLTTRQRMLNPVQRNWRISTHTFTRTVDIAAVNPLTNNPYFITHVDNSAGPGGNGSFQHPFNFLPGKAPGDIILVHRGNSTEANPVKGSITLSDNQRLLGDGKLSTVDLFASCGVHTVFGNFNLMGTSNSGVYPFVSSAGNIVTLANNNEVAGLNLLNAGGDAIRNTPAGSHNFLLQCLEIGGNAGRGIALTNASGIGIIKGINVGSADHPNPFGFGQNAGGGIVINSAGPGLDLALTNVNMNATAAKPQPFGVKLIADGGFLNVNMNNVITNGNGTGIQLSETSQQLTANMNIVRSNNNSGVGIQVQGTGGGIVVNMENVAAMNNGLDNLQIGTKAAPIVTSTVGVSANDSNFSNSIGGSGVVFSQSGGFGTLNLLNTYVFGNGVDGLGIYGTNGTLMNANVRNGQFAGNIRDAFHVEAATAATVNLFVDSTNALGSGRDGLNFNSDSDALINVVFLNDNLNNSGRSAVHGELTNFGAVSLFFDNTSGRNSGGDGFYVNAASNSIANLEVDNGTFANSGRLIGGSSAISVFSDNSIVNLLTNQTLGNNIMPNGNVGNQAYGLTLDIRNSSVFTGNIYNGDFSDTLVDAVKVNVASGSNAMLTLLNAPGNRSGFDGFVATVDNAQLGTVFTNNNFDSSGRDGMNFNVVNGGTMTSYFDNSSFNNSGRDGIYGRVSGVGSVANINLMNGSMVNNSSQNGIDFIVDAGTLNIAAFSSSISNSGLGGVTGSGVLGVVNNGGVARLNFINTTINNNLDNGVFVSTHTGSSIQGSFNLGSVSNNGTAFITPHDNDGIRFDVDGSPFSSLQVFNGAVINGNGDDGISILASNGTVFQGAFGTDLQGTVFDSGISILNNGTAPPPFVQTRAGLNVTTQSNSLVSLTLNGVTSGNSAPNGSQQFGFLFEANTAGKMTASIASSNLSNNSADAINGTVVGAGSVASVSLANVTGDRSGTTGALFNVLGGGLLNVNSSIGTSFSQSGGAGVLALIDGANSIANFGLDSTVLIGNGTAFGGQGFNGLVTNGGTLNACILNSTIVGNANQGIQLTVLNTNSVANFHVGGTTVDNNSGEGLLISVLDQGTVNYRSVGSSYSNNGTNGGLDGVKVTAIGNGPADTATARLLFSGDQVNGNLGNGFSFDAENGATMTAVLQNVSASNNGKFGVSATATGANTKFALLMNGTNTFNGNGQGAISPLVFNGIDQVVLDITGSFNNSTGDGVHVDVRNVNNAVVAVEGPGTINSSALNGININFDTVNNGSALVRKVTSINNSGADGIRIAFNKVLNGAIGIEGPTTIKGSGADAIDIIITNSNLVDGLTFGAANISVLTLGSNLPTPLNGCLPAPVTFTLNATGLVPTLALSVSGITASTSANTGINILGTNSSIQTINVANNVVVNANGTAANTGDGIHFDLTSTPVQTLSLTGNQVGGTKHNGVNFDLNASPIGTVNIFNNNIGTIQGGGGSALSDTLPIILPGFNGNTLAANDDGSSGLTPLGFAADFFGTTYNNVFVNNNGNITFNQPLFTFTPFNLLTTATPIIAPFFADVDTRSGLPVTYGTGTVGGRAAFGVNWLNVRHFNATGGGNNGLPDNTFQLVMVDRSDIAPGDFDFEFNYQQIQWESGQASGGNAVGLGGSSARVGYSNGTNTSLELAGSAVNGALLDTGPASTSLIQNSLNSVHNGRYIFFARGGLVGGPSPNGDDGIRLNATNGSSIGATGGFNVNSNTIANSGKHGIELLLTNSDLINPIFANNNIHDNGGDGIRLVNPTTPSDTITAVFLNNTINLNKGTGVNLSLLAGAGQHLNASFGSNTISQNSGGPGINIQLADNRNFKGGFDSNTISQNGAQGVNFNMGVNGQIASNFTTNTINGNKNEGINIGLNNGGHFEGAQFYGNTIGTTASRNGGIGVRLTVPDLASFNWNLGDTTRAANLITGNTDAGVGITMTGASTGTLNVANSSFSNTVDGPDPNFNGDGLRVNQAGSSMLTGGIIQSTFTNNAGDGALFNVTGNNAGVFAELNNFTVGGLTQALGNTFSNNTVNGLEFFRIADGQINNVTVQNSVLDNNTQNGLVIRAANQFRTDTYTVNSNDISRNGLNGILFDERADGNILANMDLNTITSNGSNGIRLIEQVNASSDLRALTGVWTRNVIINNKGNGIALDGATKNLLIGDPINTNLGNVISQNNLSGIEVSGAGSLTIGSNMIKNNGTLANLGTAAENAGVLLNVAPFSNITVENNIISNNAGDGVQYGIAQGFNGFFSQVSIHDNVITDNSGRGIDLINRGSNFTRANIFNNFVSANKLEGIYVINTSSTTQDQFSSSTTQLKNDGSIGQSPILELRVVNNEVLGNGLNSGLSGTGLVIRVGTSDGGFGFTFPGGFASNGAPIAEGGSPFGQSSGFGGVTAVVDDNLLGGNFGNDVLFHSFVSTVPPITSAGTWTPATFTVTAYQSDPLSRFDLYFRKNITDPGSFDDVGTSLGGFGSRNPALVAFYNNSEGVFKSRLNTIADTSAGPFNSATRARNATRLAARIPFFNAPLLSPDGGQFLYPGMGRSTWRVSNDSIDNTKFFFAGGNVDNFPYTTTNDANGSFLAPVGNNGEQPFGYGSF